MIVSGKPEIVIVGGGITGLACAYLAARKGHSVKVLEASDAFGGLLRTFPIAGTRLEYYYHHFFTHDSEILWLIKELGLEDKLFFRKTSMGVFRDGKVWDFSSPKDLLAFSPLTFLDRIRFAASSFYLGKFAKWENLENVRAMEWFENRSGKSTADALWRPLLEIKFGPFAREVPLAWMVGRLRQRMNSRTHGGTEEQLGYLKGSLQTLLDALLEKLGRLNVEFLPNAEISKLGFSGDKIDGVYTSKGRIEGDRFFFTIPNKFLPALFREKDPSYAKSLSKVKYMGAICTILELDRPLTDQYWLNVTDPGFPFGGVIEQTNFLSPQDYQGSHIIYLSRYFDLKEDLKGISEEEVFGRMIRPLRKINPEFNESWIKSRHVFRSRTAAVCTGLGFSKDVPDCRCPVAGNAFIVNMSHIYPDERSVNNSIRIAAEAMTVAGIDASDVPQGNNLAGRIGMGK